MFTFKLWSAPPSTSWQMKVSLNATDLNIYCRVQRSYWTIPLVTTNLLGRVFYAALGGFLLTCSNGCIFIQKCIFSQFGLIWLGLYRLTEKEGPDGMMQSKVRWETYINPMLTDNVDHSWGSYQHLTYLIYLTYGACTISNFMTSRMGGGDFW